MGFRYNLRSDIHLKNLPIVSSPVGAGNLRNRATAHDTSLLEPFTYLFLARRIDFVHCGHHVQTLDCFRFIAELIDQHGHIFHHDGRPGA